MTEIGTNRAKAVNKDELNAFIGNSLVLDGIGIEDIFDFLFLIGEANSEDLLVATFDVAGNIIQLNEVAVRLIFKIFEFPPLDKGLSGALSVSFIVDDEVNPACSFHSIDVFDYWVDFIEFNVERVEVVDEVYLQKDQLHPA